MTGFFFFIAAALFYVAAQGAIIFVIAYLLRKSTRKSLSLSKRRAIFFSYTLFVSVMAVAAIFDSDMRLLDSFGFVLLVCLTALAGSAFYLGLWQMRDPSPTGKMQ